MTKRLFVGGLSYSTTDATLEAAFAVAGKVVSAKVIIDKYTGRGKGFGFVEMSTEEEAAAAMTQLNGTDLDGRSIAVSEARPQEDRSTSGGGDRRPNRW